MDVMGDEPFWRIEFYGGFFVCLFCNWIVLSYLPVPFNTPVLGVGASGSFHQIRPRETGARGRQGG